MKAFRKGTGSAYAAAALLVFALGLWGCGPSGSPDQGEGKGADSSDAAMGNSGAVIEVATASGIPMLLVPGGSFMMGSADGEEDESPVHRVTLAPFVMDVTEVTHAMFEKMQLPNPSKWQDSPDKPVNQIRWRDAKQFCNERSLEEGLDPCYDETKPGWPCDFEASGYRLPTEAEWEFAARAGMGGDFPFGSADKLPFFAWFADNSGAQTHPVKSRKPNAWGFYGLYGNVSEWCQDVFDPGYYATSPAENPRGPSETGEDARRVIRGGSWKSSSSMCRVSFRQGQQTGDTDACFYTDFCGFRCVRKPSVTELAMLP